METPCCFKNSAVTEVDPCGGVEEHHTRIHYEIKKYILSMRRRCPCVAQAHSGHTGNKLTVINFRVLVVVPCGGPKKSPRTSI